MSHLELHAARLGRAAAVFRKSEYLHLAYRQMEWVMGANPFGACLMTGMRNVNPHSRYVGLPNGGIVPGRTDSGHCGYDWRSLKGRGDETAR